MSGSITKSLSCSTCGAEVLVTLEYTAEDTDLSQVEVSCDCEQDTDALFDRAYQDWKREWGE